MTVAKREKPLVMTATRVSWSAIAFALACALPLITAVVIKNLALPVPFMDEWAWATLVYQMHLGTLHFHDLWQQHNEHRMLVPNLIALGLASLGGWSQLRETLFSLLLVVVTQIGVFVLLRRIIAPRKLPFAFLAASLMLYSLAQMENWDWGFQIAWFLCNGCAVWAMVFLGTAGQSWFALAAAAGLAVVASFSSSQGLMVWLAGGAALVLTEKRRPLQIVTWTLLAVAAFTMYFHGYQHPSAHPDPLLGVYHPLTAARYFGAYFGSVFAGWLGYSVASAVGWVGIAVLGTLLVLVVIDYRSNRGEASRMAGFFGLAIYTLCVALITTAGRLGLGETQSQASRYTSIALYGWIVILALSIALERYWVPRLPPAISRLWPALLLVFAVLYAGADRAGLSLGEGRLAEVRSAFPALVAGRGTELTALFPAEAPVVLWIKQLEAVKDGPYYQ